MKRLSNGLCVLEHDSHLSRWTEELMALHNPGDVALVHNLRCIREGHVVVDGGAALGDHTASYLEKVGPTGKVYAFEPNPAYFECLTQNCPGAVCMNSALWDSETELLMDIPTSGNIGMAVVSKAGKVAVKAVTLDSLELDRCDFIKLDLEGAELIALKGAKKLIDLHRPIIQCEWAPSLMEAMGYKSVELQHWLEVMGYTTTMFGEMSVTGSCEMVAWHTYPRYTPNQEERDRMAE